MSPCVMTIGRVYSLRDWSDELDDSFSMTHLSANGETRFLVNGERHISALENRKISTELYQKAQAGRVIRDRRHI